MNPCIVGLGGFGCNLKVRLGLVLYCILVRYCIVRMEFNQICHCIKCKVKFLIFKTTCTFRLMKRNQIDLNTIFLVSFLLFVR